MRLASCTATEKILVFDRYDDISVKDHERQRRAGVVSTTFNLDLNSPLPSREAIMKNKHNKRVMSRLLSTFNLGKDMSVETRDEGVFLHDEANLFEVANTGRSVGQDSQRGHRYIRVVGLLDVAI
jgi:hypothetical protein